MEHVPCDLCGASDAETLYTGNRWLASLPKEIALVRCRACGLMYLNPRPGVDEIGEYYPSDYAAYRPAIEEESLGLMRWMRRHKMIQRQKWIEHFSGRRAGSLLDVGCATGIFPHEMARAGWQVAGVEPTRSAVEYARTKFGLDVFHGRLCEATFADGSFDVVTFWDVLEHTFSPTAELMHAAALLRPGGLIAINIPNWHSFDRRLYGPYWIGLDPPRHLYVFTRATLTALLNKSGFSLLGWACVIPSYFSSALSLNRWMKERMPGLAQPAARVLFFPGARFLIAPWFIVADWLKRGGVVTAFARKALSERTP